MSKTKSDSSQWPIIPFATPEEWRAWLMENHATVPGIWLQMAKKETGIPSIDYKQAVEGALCFGWIDGQAKKHDEGKWIQKFMPRGPKSNWSKINVDRALAGIRRAAGF